MTIQLDWRQLYGFKIVSPVSRSGTALGPKLGRKPANPLGPKLGLKPGLKPSVR